MLLTHRLGLQVAVAVLGLIPVGAGLAGVILGPAMAGGAAGLDVDSHFRYLSGLLLAIGLVFWGLIPRIGQNTRPFRMLTFLVFVGGLGRLFGVWLNGPPSLLMLGGLTMELVVTPLLCWWQSTLKS